MWCVAEQVGPAVCLAPNLLVYMSALAGWVVLAAGLVHTVLQL